MIRYGMDGMDSMVWYGMVWYGSMRMKITNLCWLLGCWGPVIGEVGVVGLVHHFAAHATTTTSNSLPQPLKHQTPLFSGFHPFSPS